MKKFVIIFFVALGLAIGLQDVRAQNTQNADLHPPYFAEEEPAGPEGEEAPVLEEGEGDGVTERGLRPFKYKKRKRAPLKKIQPGLKKVQPKRKATKKPHPARKNFRLKPRPLTSVPGSSQQPPGGSGVPSGAPPVDPPDPVEPPDPIEPPDQGDSPQECVWHTSDIVDERIDVSAQERLMAMMSRGGKAGRDASAMIGAVKQGILAGILLGPRKAVSDRGQRLTPPKGWWELIPQGQLGTCLQEPVGEPPMMLYRDKMGEANLDPSVIDHTLRTHWKQCGLPTPTSPCSYLVDLHKPPPKPGTPEEKDKEGVVLTTLTIYVTGGGYPLMGASVNMSGTYEYEDGGEKRQEVWATKGLTKDGKAQLVVPNSLQKVTVIVRGSEATAYPGDMGYSNASIFIEGSILDGKLPPVDLDPLPNLGS
jgi:hypothetical protein